MFANFTITPWHDASGERRGVIGVGFDVTDLVRQRQAAQQAPLILRAATGCPAQFILDLVALPYVTP